METNEWKEMEAIKSSMDGHPQYVSTCAQERFTELFVKSIKNLNDKGDICPEHPTMNPSTPQSQFDIARVCDQIKNLLIGKNMKYGDAALNPIRIFSKADTTEQLNVRIDDKLNRIKNGALDEDEDPEWDLLGYLILRRVQKLQESREALAQNLESFD